MKRSLLYCFLLILMSGCSMRPLGVLSHDEMVDLLVDIHVTEAAIKVLDNNSKRIEKQEYYNAVFEKHNTTKEQFDKSIDWYSKHNKKLVAIYDEVIVVVEDLQNRVENYEFHLDEKPTKNDSLETFDLWHWFTDRIFVQNEDTVIAVDSLHFSFTDTAYFYRSESLQFYLKMRVYASDTALFTTRLIYHYSDSVVDTLQYVSRADSVCRRYRFTQTFSDVRDLDGLFIELVDSCRTIQIVEVDSVELNRTYNKKLYPFDSKLRREIREARDSIKKANVDNLKVEYKTKK